MGCLSQSHHKGIETIWNVILDFSKGLSQSHHKGIETQVYLLNEFFFLQSQSHHKGIETFEGQLLNNSH
ncbi:MAG: hypothetical protein ACRCSR_05740, partial [Bacteroidales bacterium]